MSSNRHPTAIDFQPGIRIVLKGLLGVFVPPNRSICYVGFLNKTPNHPHNLKVHITETFNGGGWTSFPLERLFDPLVLHITSDQVGISFRKEQADINRHIYPPDVSIADSFNWAVALEGSEFYDKPIGARKSGFKPFLTLNKGEIYTKQISETDLESRVGSSRWGVRGHVAVVLAVDIPLNNPNDRASFKNGDEPVFESARNVFYEITVDRGAVENPSGPTVNDAEYYYKEKAIGGKIADRDKIHFQSHVVHRVGPEAACFIAYLGESVPE